MSASASPTPTASNHAHVPGGFETDTEADFEDAQDHKGQWSTAELSHPETSSMMGLDMHEPSSLLERQQDGHHSFGRSHEHEDEKYGIANNTVLEEQEMNRRLGDFESSFLPELSHLSISQATGNSELATSTLKDSFGFGRQNDNLAARNRHASDHSHKTVDGNGHGTKTRRSESPRTPPAMYMTPAPEQQQARQDESKLVNSTLGPNTSALEMMSSSPTAARTVSRVQSMATIGGYETADEHEFPDSPTRKAPRHTDDPDATPRKNKGSASSVGSRSGTLRSDEPSEITARGSSQKRRPKYLSSRSSNARLSYDSMASSATEASDATLGADFALQTGGAAPEYRLQRKPRMTLSRSTSLGSIVSGVSGMSDEEAQTRKTTAEAPDLSTLEEESPRHMRAGSRSPNAAVITPRPSNANFIMPTETVVTKHVRDLEVPGTFARQYKQNLDISPDKPIPLGTMTPGLKKGLTLKEHRSTVEKLGKENFDLKMKIHFLDQALQRRSEDGVKELITENVQLKSDRMRLEKDNHGLRKQVRDLQKKLEATGEAQESPNGDPGYATDEERSPTMEEEVMYLRERVETTEIEIEKLRTDNIAKETEKRRLAEMVRSLGDTRAAGSDVGNREERDMWKDMLESETIAREQSEEENKRMRDEIAKLRQDTFGRAGSRSRKSRLGSSVVSTSTSGEGMQRLDVVENERLKHEVSELQKMISAQASTLTSRNREKERLYQEIEDLKLGRMSGLRSIAGDSILDRSASRARSNSRISNGTRLSRLGEPEREHYEFRIGELRDEVSHLKLENQSLHNQFEEAVAELEAVDAQAQADADQFNEELIILTQERDNALRDSEDQDEAFQTLKNEAQEEIDGLGDELDAKVEECARLEEELRAQAENARALQNEVRSASEGLVRLEEDAQQNLARYQNVQTEFDEAHRQMKNMEQSLTEAENKIQRFTVQQESSHNEIAFLREEQDTDKIKIGDLESLLKKVHLNLDSERDRARDLERRLNEERSSHEVVSSQEKQEVQRVINDLNREASNAKDELRRVRRAISSKDIEVTTHKERLVEFEDSLRQLLGDTNASRSTIVNIVNKMQRDHEQATKDLDQTSKRLDDHQALLANRDALLESTGLECRKMADMLERERQARRQDKHSFEQSLRSHQQAARALSSNNARIAELELARTGHRKQMSQLEAQFKDQLAERNQVLLNIWKKMSALCGPDWAHNHSLINGNLPSQEVVGNMLFWPGFSRNLLLAVKQVEGAFLGLKDKIKTVERNMWKEYNNLEHALELRSKKLERVEESWEKIKLKQQEVDAGILNHSHSHRSRGSQNPVELQKLRGENRLLKAELQLVQQQNMNLAHIRAHDRSASRASVMSGGLSNDGAMSMDGVASNAGGGIPTRRSSMGRGSNRPGSFLRHDSNSTIEHYTSASETDRNSNISGSNQQAVADWANSPERSTSTLIIPARPFVDPQPPTNSNYPRHPYTTQAVQTQPQDLAHNRGGRPPSIARSNSIDAATTTSNNNPDSSMWIHRLRELERRLKVEREARLIDRTGMRKKLEEREAVNEELRRELERQRIKQSYNNGSEGVEADEGRHLEDQQRGVGGTRAEEGDRMGMPSLNNRVVEIEGSPVRGRAR